MACVPCIVHVTTVHSNRDVRILLKECRSLALAGYDVVQIAPGSRQWGDVSGVRCVQIPEFHNRLHRMILGPIAVFRAIKSIRPELVHLHDPELIPLGACLKFLGMKVVFDSHEDVPLDILTKSYLPNVMLRILSAAYGFLERIALSSFDGLVAATPEIGRKLARTRRPVAVVRNFPLQEEFGPVAESAPRERAACYVGGLAENRGLFEIISAAGQAEVPLHLAGQWANPNDRKKARSLAGWRWVVEHGHLDRPSVRALMQRCSVGLVVLHPVETFLTAWPVKMFEYMAAELPVIASDFPLYREIIENAGSGRCVDPQSVEAIAEAMRAIINEPNQGRQFGRSGRLACLERYCWEREFQSMLELYQNKIKVAKPGCAHP